MKLSIVTTLYHSEAYISKFYQRASFVAKSLVGEQYEIIMVNDGSPDNSLELAITLADSDKHIVVVDLSRNFGHHKALMTGLAQSTGERVFLIDSDLEEEPEWLISFEEKMNWEQCDVVYGIQKIRKGSRFEQITGKLFYQLFRFLTGVKQPNNIVTARLMTRRYVDALLLHRESELNIGGLWIATGFNQCHQYIIKNSNSPTTYTIRKKISHTINAITSFSSLPLVFAFYSGIFLSGSAMLYILFLLIRYFFIAHSPDGYISVIASIWFFSGIIVFFMGIQGIYISKLFYEVKNRPYTIIRQIYKKVQSEGMNNE